MNKIEYIDHPEIKVDEHESTVMPFRYMLDGKRQPILPEVTLSRAYQAQSSILTSQQGMLDVIKKDSERGIDDLL